jgi:hypothetical protein
MKRRKYLSSVDAKTHRAVIATALRERREEWGLQGWSFVGTGDRLRVAVRVPLRRLNPLAAATHIALGDFELKVAVLPTFSASTPRAASDAAPAFRTQTLPLAPGSPVNVEGSERCGAGGFVLIDGDPHLVTCAHAFGASDTNVQRADTGATVGTLADDLRGPPSYMDAVTCVLNQSGLDAASDSKASGNWPTAAPHEPCSTDNDQSCVLWPTHEDAPSPIELSVLSYSTDFFPFCSNPSGCAFIEVRYAAPLGDSGGPLFFGDRYYGIAKGTNGQSTFFTPFHSIVQELVRRRKKKVTVWVPD